jgi:hypothetical protein
MDREHSALSSYARRDVPRNEFSDAIAFEWIKQQVSPNVCRKIKSINQTVLIPGFLHREIRSDQWIPSPVEQSSGQSMVLGNGKPIPVILGVER